MEKEILKVWSPQPKQKMALECPADEIFYGGAKGGGKSDFLLGDFLRNLKYGPDHRGILFRRTYSELEELQVRANQIYPRLGAHFQGTSVKSGSRVWVFPSGSTLKMRYLDNDKDVQRYQGHQYTWIGFDELSEWPRDYCYIFMFSCARSPKGVPVCIRATGNPGRVGHGWLKLRFIDNKIPMKLYWDPEMKMYSTFIPAKLEDNLILMKNDPGYEARLKALRATMPHLYRAFREGDWDIAAGAAFEEFRRDKHLIHPIPIEPEWFRFCSFDWGYARPYSIGWWAVTFEGRLVRYREMYGCAKDPYTGRPLHDTGVKKGSKQLAKESWEISVAEGCKDMVADPQIFYTQDDNPTIADNFTNVGWNMVKANNDRVSGLARVHDYMKSEGSDGLPLMLIFETCYAFIRTVPVLAVDEKNPEDVDTRGEDHVYDETRYAVTSKFTREPPRERIDITHPFGVPEDRDYDPRTWEMK